MGKHDDYWRDIPGTKGKYQCSRGGEFRHVWPDGRITPIKVYCYQVRGVWRAQVALRLDGRYVYALASRLVTKTFLPPLPPGHVYIRRNNIHTDNRVENFEAISRSDMALRLFARANRRPVEKIDKAGNVVEWYPSVVAAGKANYLHHRTIVSHCKKRVKDPFARMDYTYRYEEGR